MNGTVARGYGEPHRKLRAQIARLVAGGLAVCARCGEPIHPAQVWHLDHADNKRGYLSPSLQRCNISAAQHLAQRRRGQRPEPRPEPRRPGYDDFFGPTAD